MPTDPGSPCPNGGIRLVGGSNEFEGRVEVCVGGTWGTVCQDSALDDLEAQVICRQVGYENPQDALAISAQDYGVATGPILFGGLLCTGQESRLTDCPIRNPGLVRFCTHDQDTAVICAGIASSRCVHV